MAITDEQRRRAADSLHSLPFAKMIGMRLVELDVDRAVIEIEMRDELRQPHGVLHGGVTATLIDTAMAFAVITRLGAEEKATTVNLTVHYLRPHMFGKFVCTASIVRGGKRVFTVSADVRDSDERQIATAISTYMKIS